MRLRHIEVFHAVYSSGSMTQAARLLNVSQPSISKVLAHAEVQLGFKLFQRVRGKLVATPEAHRLFDHVARLYEELSSIRRVSENLRESAEGRIRIACTPTIGLELLPGAIASYREVDAGTTFEVETLHFSELAAAITESRIDLALAFDAPSLPGVACEQLLTGRLVVIAPPEFEFKSSPPLTLQSLAGMPFVRMHQRGPLGQLLDAHIQGSGIALQEVAVSETYHVARSLVAQGLGIAIVDDITAGGDAGGDVKVMPFAPELSYRVDLLSLENRPLSLLCQRFAQHLRSALA